MRDDMTHPKLPWWRVGMVWLVVGGPALVVVAGIATTVIAMGGADEALAVHERVSAQAPAVQVRNQGAVQ
jgi:hypothetical protein